MKTRAKFLVFAGLLGGMAVLAAAPDPSGQIDRLLEKQWKEKGIQANAPASDEVFLRRIYLDVIGRIPTHEEAARFLASTDQNRRAKLIDELLASEGYVNHYFNYWADILRINTGQGGGQNIVPYYIQFVRKSLKENKPYDQFVRELVTAEGQAFDNGAIGYTYRDRGMPLDHMANTVRVFLGTRLECAQCHNHPFDKWTQMDFYHMAAFSYGMNANGRGSSAYSRLQASLRTMTEDPRERQDLQRAFQEIVRPIRNNNEVNYQDRLPQLPHDYQYTDAKPNERIQPRTMFGDAPDTASAGTRIESYAYWMTSAENPRFTTVIANRLWKRAMGMGLIEPVDEFTDSTAASNPELMKFLEEQMVASGYDMKAFLRMIFNSKVYQREATTQEVELGETYDFPGPLLRRMSAEQIWDSMVSLVNPNPEASDWRREHSFEFRILQQRMMQEALDTVEEEKLVEFTKEIAQYQAELRTETEELTRRIEELRQTGKMQEARELSRNANRLRNKLQERVMESVYQPILASQEFKLTSLELPNGEEVEMTSTMVSADGQPTQEMRKLQDQAEKEMFDRIMDERGITDPEERSRYAGLLRGSNRFLRAAHVGSPAPPSHFLREFGQSDRETIENASDEPSVPQALNLMNGNNFPQIVGRNSVLSWNLERDASVEDKIDTIYLSLLTRKPTPEEKKLILAASETRGEEIYQDAIFALMNNPEFLFVQ